jgi:uncharacterized protein
MNFYPLKRYRVNSLASVAAATAIAAADPMHKSGARTFKIRPWLLNDGSITIRVTLSEPQRSIL